MSNALSQSGLLAAVIGATTPEETQRALVSAGGILLLIWVARRAIHPKKLTLSRSPGRHNTVDILHIAFLLLVALLASAAVGQLLRWTVSWPAPPWLGEDSDVDRRTTLLVGLAVQVCGITACLLVAMRTFPLGLSRGLGLSMRHWFFDGLRAVVGCMAVYPVCVGLIGLSVWLLEPYDLVRTHDLLEGIMTSPGVFWQVLIGFSAIVMAPLAEELFFRGMLQSMLRQQTGNPWLAVTVTSVAFAAVHSGTPQNLPALFVLSLVLGYNYERTGRLVPAIAIHVLFNTIGIVLTMLRLQSAG